MRRFVMIVLMPAILTLSCSQGTSNQPTQTQHGGMEFPLSKGTHWVYEGLTRWTKPGSDQIIERTLIWKMEVVETIERSHLTAAVLKGHPTDLAWYEEGKPRGEYLIIRVGPGKMYLVSGEQSKEVFNRLKNSKDLLGEIVGENELFLDLPLKPGKVFGPTEHITRQDVSYCWVVQEANSAKLAGIRGISPREATRYKLIRRTRPEHEIMEFVPGIGITRYVYEHHGTTSSTDLKLVEYHEGVK